VFVRWLVLAVASSVLLLAGCGSDDDDHTTTSVAITPELAGDWTGQLTQKGIAPFQIAVRIASDGTGRVAYTGIECGGRWTAKNELASSPPAAYNFREEITQGVGGECKGKGVVSIGPNPPRAPKTLSYGFSGGGVSSAGSLHKTDAAGLEPVFDEAGVTPP
jgi:hypothetical protein